MATDERIEHLTEAAERASRDARKAMKDTRRMMQLTLFAVLIAIVVLAIDHTIKRAIVTEAQQVREIFAEFQEATRAIRTAAEQGGASDSPADSPDDPGSGGVANGARARTAPGGDAAAGKPAAARSKGRAGSRP